MRGKACAVCLGVCLLLSAVLVTSVPASAPGGDIPDITPPLQAADADTPLGNDHDDLAATQSLSGTLFLPLLLHEHHLPRECPLDSPFSLQIAALHQVEADKIGEAQAFLEENYDRLVDALWESGACWSRVRIDWNLIQPDAPVEGEPPTYEWGPYHDEKLALVAGTGVNLIGTIDDVPDWAADEPYSLSCSPIRQDRLDEFAQFLTDLVTRYKEPPWNIHTWELRNEPDGTTANRDLVGQGCGGLAPEKYVQMLATAYPAIKAADPDATVLMGGIAYDWFIEYDGPFYRYFADDVMTSDGDLYLDAVNLHYFADWAAEWERWVPEGDPPTCGVVDDGIGTPYAGWGIDILAKANHFVNRMSVCHGVEKPLWVTELAEHGYPDQPETLPQQARYIIQGHARALAAGAQNVTWFALVSPPYDPSEQGLLYTDFSPKPAFYAYQTLTRELADYDYSHALDVQDVEGYVFHNSEGQFKVVAWAWGEPLQPAYLTVSGISRLRTVDRDGNVTYVEDGAAGDFDGVVNGSIRLELPAPPTDPNPEDSYRYTAEPLFLSP